MCGDSSKGRVRTVGVLCTSRQVAPAPGQLNLVGTACCFVALAIGPVSWLQKPHNFESLLCEKGVGQQKHFIGFQLIKGCF